MMVLVLNVNDEDNDSNKVIKYMYVTQGVLICIASFKNFSKELKHRYLRCILINDENVYLKA